MKELFRSQGENGDSAAADSAFQKVRLKDFRMGTEKRAVWSCNLVFLW